MLAPLLLFGLPENQEALRLLLMAVGATGAGVALSWGLGPESPERLREFYRRVRPPGFWGPVAAAVGDDPSAGVRRLGRGLAAVALASVTVFFLVSGLGSWLAGSPGPTWWPLGAPTWIAFQLGVAVVVVPGWIRLAFRGVESSEEVRDDLDPAHVGAQQASQRGEDEDEKDAQEAAAPPGAS